MHVNTDEIGKETLTMAMTVRYDSKQIQLPRLEVREAGLIPNLIE